MLQLTFLKGIKQNYNASKTFQFAGGQVRKISDYDIGATFYHRTESYPLSHPHLRDVLKKQGDMGWFHILGTPAPNLSSKVSRKKINFTDEPTRNLVVDIDKLTLPPDIARKWINPQPQVTIVIIRMVLRHLKLDVLADANFTYVLTSSQLDRTTLSCHLYFFLDASVSLRDLRRWAMVMNKGYGKTVLDPAIYRSVQPIYIAPPVCKGFDDPFKDCRIGYSEIQRGTTVAVDDLKRLGFVMQKLPTPTNLDASYQQMATSVEKKTDGIKKNWLDTIEALVGKENINKPAHRAAAQMVREEGSAAVKANLDHYVDIFYNTMWKAIKAHGKRGNQSDIDTYTKDKVRNYIESAADKDFGEQADKLKNVVLAAISKAQVDGTPTPLTTRDVLRAYAQLEDHFSAQQEVRAKIVSSKVVSIGAFEKQAKMVGKEGVSKLSIDDPTKAFAALFNKITLIEARDGTKYLHWLDPNEPLGYRLVRALSPKCIPYVAEYFAEITATEVPPTLRQMLRNSVEGRVMTGRGLKKTTSALVGRRIISTPDKIYYRAGTVGQSDITVVITKDRVEYKKSIDLPVYWEQTENKSIRIPSREQIKEQFGEDRPTLKQTTTYLKQSISRYIRCEPDSIPNVISLAVSLLVRDPLIYLGVFIGGASTGKTFGSSIFKLLFDPPGSDEAVGTSFAGMLPKKFDDALFTKFMENDVVAFDNVESVNKAQQAIFSQISTGSEIERRMLYTMTNEKVKLFQCVILNSLASPVTEADLASRTLEVHFSKPVTKNANEFRSSFLRDAPMIRYCLFEMTSAYMSAITMLGAIDIGVRDVIGATVKVLAEFGITSDLVGKVLAEGIHKKAEDIRDNALILMFLAFMEEQKETEIDFDSPTRWQKFKRWLPAHDTIKSVTLNISGVSYSQEVMIDVAEVPDKIRAFDMAMGSAQANINAVSQWEVTKPDRKTTNGRRVTRYKFKIENIL